MDKAGKYYDFNTYLSNYLLIFNQQEPSVNDKNFGSKEK